MILPYRRHSGGCLKDLQQRKLPKGETIRTFSGCDCAIWYSGSWNGKRFPRKSTKFNNWKRAETFCAKLMEEPNPATSKPATKSESNLGLSVHDAIEKWHTKCTLKLGESTMEFHRLLGKRLIERCETAKVYRVVDIDQDLINAFRGEWKTVWQIADSTTHTWFVTLQSFFHYAKERKWITDSPMATKDKPVQNLPTKADTMPLDPDGGEENYRRVLAALARMELTDPRTHPLRKPPARMVALGKLMYEGGMRISDAIQLDTSKVLIFGGCANYEFQPMKTRRYPQPCPGFFSLETFAEIMALPPISPNHPFWDGKESSIASYQTTAWRYFIAAGNQAFVPHCHPHRFRNSFAVNKLNNGATMEDVSRWLGHRSVKTTQRSYSPWVKSRLDASRRNWLNTQATPEPPTAPNVVTIRPKKQA